jgi:hypothetical protein
LLGQQALSEGFSLFLVHDLPYGHNSNPANHPFYGEHAILSSRASLPE